MRIVAIGCLAVTLLSSAQGVESSGLINCELSSQDEDDTSRTTFADVIILRTRIHKGKHQYRHWNETWGRWVEPHWIDA